MAEDLGGCLLVLVHVLLQSRMLGCMVRTPTAPTVHAAHRPSDDVHVDSFYQTYSATGLP